jgi:hypothetical protein
LSPTSSHMLFLQYWFPLPLSTLSTNALLQLARIHQSPSYVQINMCYSSLLSLLNTSPIDFSTLFTHWSPASSHLLFLQYLILCIRHFMQLQPCVATDSLRLDEENHLFVGISISERHLCSCSRNLHPVGCVSEFFEWLCVWFCSILTSVAGSHQLCQGPQVITPVILVRSLQPCKRYQLSSFRGLLWSLAL